MFQGTGSDVGKSLLVAGLLGITITGDIFMDKRIFEKLDFIKK